MIAEIKQKTFMVRAKVTFFLMLTEVVLIALFVFLNWFNISIMKNPIFLMYLTGIIFALGGLTFRAIIFLEYVDTNRNGQPLPIGKQIQNVYGTYFLKYIPIIIVNSIIVVSLILSIFVKSGNPNIIDYILNWSGNFFAGFYVSIRDLLRLII